MHAQAAKRCAHMSFAADRQIEHRDERCAGAGWAGFGSKELARDTILRLRNLAQIYDLDYGCLLGEEQMGNTSAPRLRVQLFMLYCLKEVHESRSSISRL